MQTVLRAVITFSGSQMRILQPAFKYVDLGKEKFSLSVLRETSQVLIFKLSRGLREYQCDCRHETDECDDLCCNFLEVGIADLMRTLTLPTRFPFSAKRCSCVSILQYLVLS